MSAGHIGESTSNQAFTNIRFRDHLEDTSIFKNCHLGLSSLGMHWTQWLLLDVDDPFGLGSSKLTLDDERLYHISIYNDSPRMPTHDFTSATFNYDT